MSDYALGFDIYRGDDNIETPNKINFNLAIENNMSFVFIKAGGGRFVDPLFKDSWARSKDVGLLRGAYWWLTPDRSPSEQVTTLLSQLNGDIGELPVVVDYERQPTGWPQWADRGRALNYLKQFLYEVEVYTKKIPAIYTGPSYWAEMGSTDSYWLKYPLWIANYSNDHKTPLNQPIVPKPWSFWTFWQWGDKLDGLKIGLESKDADYNYYNGTVSDLLLRYGKDIPPVVDKQKFSIFEICFGQPTEIPDNTSGVAVVYDKLNNCIWAYNDSWKKVSF
jgi:lysozyme